MNANALADSGNEEATALIDKIGLTNPIDASLLRASLRAHQGRAEEAVAELEKSYVACRADPWPMLILLRRSFTLASDIAAADESGAASERLYRALEKPFAVSLAEADRRWTLAQLGSAIDRRGFGNFIHDVIASYEPDVPWEREFLQTRRACYQALSDPRAAQADRDLKRFLGAEPPALDPEAAAPNE
jgi:hypothetical protein